MKYGIVGSRRRSDKHAVIDFINSLKSDDIVISGGCRGVDTWAVEAAREIGLETLEIRPVFAGCRNYWESVERFYERNRKIAAACDVLVAFVAPDRKGGAENTIKHARKMRKKIIIL